ncbi:MAG: hypothetical protein HW421_2330 [Ignavibacteria bacterium]|nr:hypothetical protein [Ignavibacteria bacterium]
MSDILFIVLMFVVGMGLSVLGLYLVRRFGPTSMLEAHNEEEGFVYAVVGVIYAVLLAFLVLIVWEQFNTANERVEQEAATVSSLNKDVKCFPEAFKLEFKQAIGDYCLSMIEDEFPAMANGKFSPKTDSLYQKVWTIFYAFEPKTEKEKFWYPEVINKINQLGSTRRLRIMSVNFGIPSFMWYMIILGAIIIISYGYLFYTKRFLSQAIIILYLSAIVILVLVIVYALDHPFSGIIRVSDEPFIGIMHYFK